ncbi:hypothetical protein PAXRUDRAFT_168711, partial [Paxillus rubicundulus Ve08.2h10]
THEKKLQLIFKTIQDVAKWFFAEFLYHTFCTKDGHSNEVLCRWDHHLPVGILDLWLKHPDGWPRDHRGQTAELPYSLALPYLEIKAARATITSFAVQIIEKQLHKEQKVPLCPSNGLAMGKASSDLTWEMISSTMTESMMNTLMAHQPLYWHYTLSLAAPLHCLCNGVLVVCKYRPLKIVHL